MRSVIVHLKNADIEGVKDLLEGRYTAQEDQWIGWVNQDPCLYIAIYTHLLEEASEDELTGLKQRLGKLPSVSLIADISGRHHGGPQVVAFVSLLLERFEGVATDDYSDDLWTLEEIVSQALKVRGKEKREFFSHFWH